MRLELASVSRAAPSAIPVGTQFSPDLFDLEKALDVFVRHSGDKAAIQQEFWKPPVHKKHAGIPSSRRTASLPLEAAAQYGLLTPRQYEATDLCRDLANLSGPSLMKAFGRHILLNLGGLRVVEGAEQMEADGLKITGNTIAEYLSDQGFKVIVQNTAIRCL